MSQQDPDSAEGEFLGRTVQAAVRIGLVLLLVAWCFTIVRPFVIPAVWGIIIAVALHGPFEHLQGALGARRGLAGAVIVVVGLLLVIAPTIVIALSIVENAPRVADALGSGEVAVPAPPQSVADWPVIGPKLHAFWELASTNLRAALAQLGPQLAALGAWFLRLTGGLGLAIVQFVVAIVIAAVLLTNAEGGARVADDVARRLVGPRGTDYARLARTTIRSVARGIVGIALIQAILAGLGFVAVGLPGAGMLALLCLVLAIVQIGPGLVIVPAIIYQFSVGDTTPAVIFALWGIFVTLLDNILKPIMLGRGVEVPVLVVFLGAIGGLLSSGILGLFVGPVVLGLGYTIFGAWVDDVRDTRDEPTTG